MPYVVPFGVFLGWLALRAMLPIGDLADQTVPLVVVTAVLVWLARPVLNFRVKRWTESVLLGILVFVLWVGPDLLFPGYRQHWLFENAITGAARTTLSAAGQGRPGVLALRTIRAVTIVPIVEELFWRGWLMRWLISPDFRRVPLGACAALSFWLTALLFASEHGSYWEVGLVAGILYNWWMIRTKSLGDLILAHAITNACLSVYVVTSGKWEYWL